MKTQRKIIIFLVITLGFFLLTIVTHQIISLHQKYLYFQNIRKSQETVVDNLFKYKETRLYQFTCDYAACGETIEFTKTNNKTWVNQNIKKIMPYYFVDYLWIYNFDKKFIYTTDSLSNNNNYLEPFPNFILTPLFQNTSETHFFVRYRNEIIELFGSTIHHTNDPDGRYGRFGYLFTGKIWSKKAIGELMVASGLDAKLELFPFAKKIPLNDRTVAEILHDLKNWKNEQVARITFIDKNPMLKNMHDIEFLSVTLFISILIISGFFIFTNRWINKPLAIISQTLDTGKIELLSPISNKHGEFSKIAEMIHNFFVQKSELESEMRKNRKTTQSLRESEEKYRTLLDLLPDPVFYHSGSNVIYANKATGNLLGYSDKELFENDLLSFIAPEYHKLVVQNSRLRMNDFSPDTYEIDLIHKNQNRKTVVVRAAKIHLNNQSTILVTLSDITERKQIETSLKRSEQLFRSYFELPLNGIAIISSTLCWQNVNEKLCEILGYPKEQLYKMTWIELTPIEDRTYEIQLLNKIYKGAINGKTYEKRFVLQTGKYIDVKVSIIAVPKNTNDIDYFVATIDNITESKKAQKALLESEEKFRHLFNSAVDVIYTISPEGKVLSLNPAFKNITGWEPEIFIGKTFTDLLHPDDLEEAIHIHMRIQEGYMPPIFTHRFLLKSGEYAVAEFSATPLIKDGTVYMTLGIARDITNRRKAEENLREAEERFRNLFNHAPIGIYRTSRQGKFIMLNPSLVTMLGYETAEHLFTKDVGFSYKRLLDRENFVNQFIDKSEIIGFEAEWKRADDSIIYVRENARAIRDENGDIIAFEGTVEDVTKTKETERQLRLLNAELQLKNEAILSQTELLEYSNRELEQLSIVASKTDNAVIIANEKGVIEWVNEGFNRLFGEFFTESIIEKGIDLTHTSFNPNISKVLAKSIEEKKSTNYITETVMPSGESIWLQTTLTPIFDLNNRLTKFIAIDTDVTKLKKAEQAILQNNEEIQTQRDEIEKKNKTLQLANSTINTINKNMTDSIVYAERIQKALLANESIFHEYFPDSFIIHKPKDIVSGDFYWITRKKNNILFAAIDCTGHGVPGAFMSIISNNLLNQAVNEKKIMQPAEILMYLSNGLNNTFHQSDELISVKDGMDLALCSFDTKTLTLQYAGVYNPLFILRDDEIIIYKADKHYLGEKYSGILRAYTNHEIQLQKDDSIYIFSDGFVDQFGGPFGRRFMSQQLKTALLEIKGLSMNLQKKYLEELFMWWKGRNSQIDDVLLIGIKV